MNTATHARTATILSALTTLLAAAFLTLAGMMAYDSAQSDGDLAGLGYIVAAVVAAPAAVGLALAVPAFLLRRRPTSTARVLGWAGLGTAALPVALMLAMRAPSGL